MTLPQIELTSVHILSDELFIKEEAILSLINRLDIPVYRIIIDGRRRFFIKMRDIKIIRNTFRIKREWNEGLREINYEESN